MDRRSWLLFATICVLWGIPYFFIKVALHGVSPEILVWARVVIGAFTLLPLVFVSSGLRQLWMRRWWLLLLAVIEVALPFTLIAAGEERISSSLTGILIATEPLAIGLLAFWIDPSERLSGLRWVGLLLGLSGVVVLLGLAGVGRSTLVGAGMVLVATACYGAGALLIRRRFSDVPPVLTTAVTLTLSAVLLAIPAALAVPDRMPSLVTVAALLILGVACTGAGFIAFFALIARAGAGRASLITYVAPVVAVALGVVVAHEHLGAGAFVGVPLILLGSWLAARRPSESVAERLDLRESAQAK